jgi:hypothetical protein
LDGVPLKPELPKNRYALTELVRKGAQATVTKAFDPSN